MANIVALTGRPNVGKSTLFNRLTKTRHAIVDPAAGVTRDRHYGKSDWNGVEFSVIDTGGYVEGSDDVYEKEIRRQVEIAIEEADIVLFMVDVMEGITPMDRDVANLIRKSGKKSFLVANKADNSKLMEDASQFYELGMSEVYPVSSINGSGTGDLLDDVVRSLQKIPVEETVEDLPRFAVVGRPNVGKSSLVNTLLCKERNIVTTVPGTTRDSIYTRYSHFGFDFYLIDTAGLRKKGKVTANIEFYSVLRSVRAIEKSDVCLLMIDAQSGMESQDLNIFHLAAKNHKGIVILVNKWDIIEKETNTIKKLERSVRDKISPFSDVPVIFTSVIKKQRIFKAMEIALRVYDNRKRKIPTRRLNEYLLPLIENNPPPVYKGKRVKIKYITQIRTYYPSFAFFCNLPQYVKEPYKRFLENKIRELWDFGGVPITIYLRKK